MKSITVGIDGIGLVLFERSTKAKRMNISVRPVRGVRVAVPRGVSLTQAARFVYTKRGWIQKHVAAQRMKETEHEAASDMSADIDRIQAKTMLINRLNELAVMHGFIYEKVFIKNQKTRWGSCSVRNNINLNISLVRLPSQLIDYVLLHELVHTQIKNHSAEFWAELDTYVCDARKLHSQLKSYSQGLLPGI